MGNFLLNFISPQAAAEKKAVTAGQRSLIPSSGILLQGTLSSHPHGI
jgi:hypothetical protein